MTHCDGQACDLLILGAGAAGAAAAIQARRHGLSVVLLEARLKRGARPGETLHPGVEPILAALGVDGAALAASTLRHEGIWIEWDGPRRFVPYGSDEKGPWRGFQIDRARLDAILLDAAVAAGARLLRPLAPRGVLREAGRVAGVLAGNREIRARHTLDATGRRAWLARELGLAPERRSPPWRLRFGWTAEPRGAGPEEPVIRAAPGGWDWQAPLGDGRQAWVTLRMPDAAESRSQHAASFAWRIHRACAGPGYFLLGDAAQILDPASSHGILRALMSGMLVAHLAAGCKRHDLPEVAAQVQYRTWIDRQFEADVAALTELYARHPGGLARQLAPATSAVAFA